MTFDPNKYNPTKVDISKLKNGLSKLQMNKIAYECDLLRVDIERLIYLAPFLFIEGVTTANTKITNSKIETIQDLDDYDNYNNDSSFYDSGYL